MDYEKLHKDTIAKLQEMVNSGKITVETACGICADFIPESKDEKIMKAIIKCLKWLQDEARWINVYGSSFDSIFAWVEKQRNLMKALQISNARIGELIEENYYLKEQFEKQDKNNMGISKSTKKKLEDSLNKALEKETPEFWNEFLDDQGERKPYTDFSDFRTWKYIVDAVLTEKEGIGQYLDSPFTEEVAKKLQKRFGNIEQILANSAKTCNGEQKPAEWHSEDEQNLNACLGYIPDEFLRRWLTDIIHVKYDKSVELPKGVDYGIDGLYAAIDILQKTLGDVDGYQSDDGILEHKCAISAVKELSKQQKSFWSEEDKKMSRLIGNAITTNGASIYLKSKGIQVIDAHVWLDGLKERIQPQITWKPSDEQIGALESAISLLQSTTLESLYNELKKLRGE